MVWIEIFASLLVGPLGGVTTFAVVWIEIDGWTFKSLSDLVTTFAVVWIEMHYWTPLQGYLQSPPSRWCGLK